MKKAILISGFGWYEERLKPVSEVLEEKGYKSVCYLSDFNHQRKKYFIDTQNGCKYIHVPVYKKNLSVARLFSHMIFGYKLKKILKKEKPDLIYCMVPPNSAAMSCLKYKKKHPVCKYYLDIIDMWPESMPIRDRYKNNIIFKKWGYLRNASVPFADHIFTECRLYQNRLKNILKMDRVSTLYLFKELYDKDNVLKCIEEKKKKYKKNKITLCYLGSINNLISIDKICMVLALLVKSGIFVELRIIGEGEAKDRLVQSAKDTGAEVKYYGLVYERSEKLNILGCCDYGFNIMKDYVEVGLTIKSVDYFSMGIPIINGIKGDTWKFVEKKNIGVNYKENGKDIVYELINGIDDRSTNAFNTYEKYFTRDAFKQTVYEAMM